MGWGVGCVKEGSKRVRVTEEGTKRDVGEINEEMWREGGTAEGEGYM